MITDSFLYEGSMYAFFSTLQNFPLSGRAPLFRRVGERGLATMLVWGSGDQVTPIAGMDIARLLLHPAEVHVLDCGHMAPYERPTEVAEHVATFAAAHTDRIKP